MTSTSSIFYLWLGKLYDINKFYATRDPLTEVYNRRFTYEIFLKLLSQVDRNNKKLSVFIIDVDKFKNINDTYGHEKGDLVLKEITNSFLSSIRKGDVVARWGGDEFLIIAPISDEISSLSMVNRFEKGLQEVSKRIQINTSVSIGEATFPDEGKNLDDLIKLADDRMYENKRKKRERRVRK